MPPSPSEPTAALPKTVFSGGQTGVDRAALDAAIALNLPHGGWCPQGRRAEDGPLDPRYNLRETPSSDYAQRTAWNVRDSDGTLILTWGEPQGGTKLTIEQAAKRDKPHLAIDLRQPTDPQDARRWLTAHSIRTLNIAGPRQQTGCDIYRAARAYLMVLLGTV